MNVAVILPAAGASTRFGLPTKKPFTELLGQPVWLRTVNVFRSLPEVQQMILVISQTDLSTFQIHAAHTIQENHISVVVGGSERYLSVWNGLNALDSDIDYVAIHDAVRPLVLPDDINHVFHSAKEYGAAILATPVVDTLKRCTSRQSTIDHTMNRDGLWRALTPQVFRRDLIMKSYQQVLASSPIPQLTDDAQFLELCGHSVQLVQGRADNIKITTPSDLLFAEAVLLARRQAG